MLTVYKASAGSGKTFQLVMEYLKLLIEKPYNYKHILAVTFTNKATNEMKRRILEQLNFLGSGEKSDYLPILTEELNQSEKFIREQSKLVLKNILHDYNRFSINTIDSFTQRVIKAFNREIGISPNFILELDNTMVLEEAVDRLLAKLDSDKKLREWLVKFSKEKIEDNYSQQIEDDIKSLGRELFNERFQLFFPEKDDSVYTRENLENFWKELQKITAQFENTLRSKAQNAVSDIHQNGFDFDDFSYKLSGVAGYFKKLSESTVTEPGARVMKAAEDSEKWCAKNHVKKTEVQTLVENKLRPALIDILTFYTENSTIYFTAVAVKKQLRMLGILTDLKEEIKELLQEKGMLQISDSNMLLSRIIGGSESPFIYEKIGNHFHHFMLDEFQDTSALQWNNFKPLVANSLAEGNENLLVGDVKQSIYRWRNSDWNILATGISDAFPGFPPDEKPLEKNWRSDRNIIDFNNEIVTALTDTFQDNLFVEIDPEERPSYINKFRKIYEHFIQEPGKPEKPQTGLVHIDFLPEDDFEETSSDKLVQQVKLLQDNGMAARDIAILIRKNSEGTKIIETFLQAAKKPENANYNLSVLSNESLFLHASKGVNFVIGVIELLIDPENKISKALLLHFWKTWLLPELNSKGIVPYENQQNQLSLDFNSRNENWQLESGFENEFEDELQPFFDKVQDKVLLASLDETITHIGRIFHLFEVESELPFLQTLIDKSAEIKTSISNDLSNLLHWWNEKGYKTSVSVNEDTDSVRLLTVHKAKGLEYSAVLLPNFNWDSSWSGNFAPTLWCKSEKKPFNQFPLLPVKASKDLQKTWFKQDFYEEKVSSFIDTMNLVYVAITRAKSVLMVNCKNVNKPGKSVNGLLKTALTQLGRQEKFAESWNDEQTFFQFGGMPQFIKKEKSSNSILLRNYAFSDFSNRIKLRINSEGFLVKGEINRTEKNTGKLVHEIMAAVNTEKDVEKACKKALSEGKINENEYQEIVKIIRLNLNKPEVKSWFDGSYSVLNERNILSTENIQRPDRIMISENNAVVVDYKFGDRNPEKYNSQVKRYAAVLKKTGFEKVIGYLWYINQNEVEKVCDL